MLGLSISLGLNSVVMLRGGGRTSGTRYSVMGTGMRWPTTSGSSATNTFMAVEFYFGTPGYAVTDPRVFCPSFWNPSGGSETLIAGGASISIQGWAIETSTGVWTACDGAAEAGVATVDNSGPGAWLPRVAATLTANTKYRARMTFVVSATSVSIPFVTVQGGPTSPGGQERSEGSTTTRFARLSTTGANLSNSGGVFYKPAMMVAKGGDGRKAILVLGDSIGYGSNETAATAMWSSRNTFGYVERGLDSASGALRLGYHMMCIPGQRAAGVLGWDVAANWANKRAALQAIYDLQGEWPFDEIVSEHITNSIPYSNDGGDLRVGMGRFYDLLASTYGKPVTQIEGLAATTSSDGFATVVNQTEQSGYDYGSVNVGHLWPFNEDVGGTSGLGDAAAYYRAQGKITGSIAPWRYASADTGSNRDRYPVQAFSTTLSSAYVSGSSISTVAAPAVGAQIVMEQDSGDFGTLRIVTAVTGAGPYTVTLSGSPGTAAAIGKVVREVWGDGIHPSGILHRDILTPAIVDWKIARGWV